MNATQRMWAQVKFQQVMADLYGNAFETFFHRLMELCQPGYIPIRTHGNLGDQGADGLSLHDRRLFACYGPATINVSEIRGKFHADLRKALAHRRDQFDTFVFVHNDHRGGLHPELGSLLRLAGTEYAPLKFDQMGPQKLWHKAMLLSGIAIEELLRCQIPVEPLVFGIGMAELAPLLEHLHAARLIPDEFARIPAAGVAKIEFNRLSETDRMMLLQGMRVSYLVGEYYAGIQDAYAHDQAAAGFTAYYHQLRDASPDDSESIMWDLQTYVHGNKNQPTKAYLATWVILAYFFERCHIFEVPPQGWSEASVSAGQP